MALDKERLKGKIKAAFRKQSLQEDYETALDELSQDIAIAVVDEILQLTVTVPKGIAVATTGTATAHTGNTTEDKVATLE